MAYYTGMRAGDGKVSATVLDERHLHHHGKVRYLVYIQNSEGQALWKSVENMPCILEFDLDF